MSSVIKQSTVRHSEVVGQDELLLRRIGLMVPEFYRLTDYQQTLITGYVDTTYTHVILKSGEVMHTRMFKRVYPTTAPKARKQVADYGRQDRTHALLKKYTGFRANYNGLHYKSINFLWYPKAMGGRITLRHPDTEEHILDCYMFCDTKSQWLAMCEFMGGLYRIMVTTVTPCTINDKPVNSAMLLSLYCDIRVRQQALYYLDAIDYPEALPSESLAVLKTLNTMKLKEDHNDISYSDDMKTLLTALKLNNTLGNVSVFTSRNELPGLMKGKFRNRGYLKEVVKHVLSYRLDVPNPWTINKIIRKWMLDDISGVESDIAVACHVWIKMTTGLSPVGKVLKEDISKLPNNSHTQRLINTLPTLGVKIV